MRSRRTPVDDIALRATLILAVVMLAAVYMLFVGTDAGRAIDTGLATRDFELRVTGPVLVIGALFYLSLSPVGVVLLIVGVVWQAGRLGRRDDGIRAALIVAGAAIGARVLKFLFEALDPFGGEAARQIGPGFYPSGHAAVAMALCLGAFIVLRDQRLPLLPLGGLWCGVHGFAIVAVRSHHFSDVLGGFLLAFAIAASIGLRAVPAARLSTRTARTAILMLAGVIAAVVAAQLARDMAVASLSPQVVRLVVAVGLCIAAIALTATFLRLLVPSPRAGT